SLTRLEVTHSSQSSSALQIRESRVRLPLELRRIVGVSDPRDALSGDLNSVSSPEHPKVGAPPDGLLDIEMPATRPPLPARCAIRLLIPRDAAAPPEVGKCRLDRPERAIALAVARFAEHEATEGSQPVDDL